MGRKKLFPFGILFLLAFVNCAPVYLSRKSPEGEMLLRIALQRHQPGAAVYGSYSIFVSDSDHRTEIAPGERWLISATTRGLRAETGRGSVIESNDGRFRLWSNNEYFINDRRVKGAVDVRPETGGGLMVIAEMPLEEYLPGVLSLELGGLAERAPEAAKAQAVVSRSYAYARIGANPRSYFDIEAGTSHQCFDLDNLVSSVIKQAVADTRGQVLTCQGRVISPNFHSTCGGKTAYPSEVWNARDEDFPFLGSIDDQWCVISPKFTWTDTLYAENILNKIFQRQAKIIKDIKVGSRGKSGRVISLIVSSDAGDTLLTKAAVRNGMREKPLLSTGFDIENQRDAAGNIERIILKGRGYGHGVGLCQWGAIGMARAGKGYKDILRHYFNGINIEIIY